MQACFFAVARGSQKEAQLTPAQFLAKLWFHLFGWGAGTVWYVLAQGGPGHVVQAIHENAWVAFVFLVLAPIAISTLLSSAAMAIIRKRRGSAMSKFRSTRSERSLREEQGVAAASIGLMLIGVMVVRAEYPQLLGMAWAGGLLFATVLMVYVRLLGDRASEVASAGNELG